MKRSVYIPKAIWEKLGEMAESMGRPSKSNVICHLVESYARCTYRENTGKTLLNVSRETIIGESVDGKRLLNVGRESNDVNVAGVATPPGGVLRLSMAEVEKVYPDLAKEIRASGSLADKVEIVEYGHEADNFLKDDCAHEVTMFDETINADICANCGKVFYEKPDVADVVKKDEENRKERAVSQLKRDLDELVDSSVRPYSKDRQLGKKR